MLTQEEFKRLAEKLREIAPPNSKIKYDVICRFWTVSYEKDGVSVSDCYRFTSNRGFILLRAIRKTV